MPPRIPRCHAALGWICRALVVAMILVGAFNAIGRYAGKFTGVYLSSNAYLELQAQLFALMFLLGGAYTLFHDAHVRVDILHERMSSRTRAWVEAIGTLCLLLPFCAVMFRLSLPWVADAWARKEISGNAGGLPLYPLKTIVPVAFALLFAQGLANLAKAIRLLRGKRA